MTVHPATKLFGAGLIVLAAPLSIWITARPRSLVPSARKRKTPSAPLKPDGLVSAAWLYGSDPPFLASAAASVTASYESVARRAGSPLNLAL